METAEQRTKREAEQTKKRDAFLRRHNADFLQARFHLEDLDRQHEGLQGQDHLKAALRVLIDLNLKHYPAHDLARRFVSLCVLLPQELRVPFIAAVARYSRPDGDEDDFSEWKAFKTTLLKCGNKLSALVFELDVQFSSWRPRDPAQGTLFDAVMPIPDLLAAPLSTLSTLVVDDGGVQVDVTTGEVPEEKA